MAWAGSLLPQAWQLYLVERLVEKSVRKMTPGQALQFLFKLDATTYSLEGPLAVQYGGGVHPKHRQTAYHDFFVDRVRRGERVLDLGCGIGAVAFDLAQQSGAIVDGIDLSAESIQEAKKRYIHPNLKSQVGDALTLDASSRYDTVLLSNVLEHIQDRVSFLKRAISLTGARRFLIRVPLFERDWRVPLKQELGVEWRLDLDHKIEHTVEAFKRETEEAGLLIQHMETPWGEIWAELDVKKP
jgi:2-polyprenyl-3-methyl-5-hydroxy-6-metoxy-1,4-benzoquinol methylase